MCLVKPVQHMWRTGEIPQELGWTVFDPHTQRGHRHRGHRTSGDPLEGGRGAHRNLSTRKPPVSWRPTQVTGRKRDGDGYNGAEACTRDHPYILQPPLPGLPGPNEGMRNIWYGTPHTDLGRIWRGISPVWNLEDFLGPLTSSAKTEWILRSGLTCHTWNNTWRPRISDTTERGCGQYHTDMVGYGSVVPKGVPRRYGRGNWAVPGSLLCRWWHVWL